jgi:hypothetical protein
MSHFLQVAVLWLLPYLGPDDSALEDPSCREDWFDSLMGEHAMLAAEWARSADPLRMLDLARGKVSERKLRLFAVACLRRVWDFLLYQECQRRSK